MPKLNDYEFEYLINVALDTNDKEMFDSLMEKQKAGTFLQFPLTQEEKDSFEEKEKAKLIKDLRHILSFYQYKTGKSSLENLLDDVQHILDKVDEKLINHEIDNMPANIEKGIKFSPMPMQYITAVSYEVAQEAYKKHAFPGEDLDSFVDRYFFGGNGEVDF